MVSNLIPPHSEVVDVCCGDCAIAPLLRAKGCRYVGLDLNPFFVTHACARGVDVRRWDARTDPVPTADVIVIQSALYHFIDRDRELLRALMEKARRVVIVSEPVENWATSGSRILRSISRTLTRVEGEIFERRYTEHDLRMVITSVAPRARFIGANRNIIASLPVEQVK